MEVAKGPVFTTSAAAIAEVVKGPVSTTSAAGISEVVKRPVFTTSAAAAAEVVSDSFSQSPRAHWRRLENGLAVGISRATLRKGG